MSFKANYTKYEALTAWRMSAVAAGVCFVLALLTITACGSNIRDSRRRNRRRATGFGSERCPCGSEQWHDHDHDRSAAAG